MKLSKEIMMIIVPFLFSVLFIPIVKKIAEFIGAMDIPNERKVHKEPIARLGGLGIYGGFLFGYMLFGHQSIQMNAILIGSIIIVITGIIDDIRPVPAKYKLLGQLAGAAVIPFYGKIILQDVSAFGIYLDFGIFAPVITMIFIVGIINCINLIDGLDGLAGGIASIYFLTIGIIALLLNHTVGLDLSLALIMLGCTLGFLFHNFYPAKIFMGDSGSMFLGYIISVIALLGFKNVTLTSLVVPCLILAIPILDTLFAIIRRIVNHKPISAPDKNHFHHQLLKLNLGQGITVLIIYIIDILFAIASIIYAIGNTLLGTNIYGIVLYIILFILTLIFVIKTDIIWNHSRK
jgi:UDP-GlcNAc:undecaprenyl-phosphate/decaprenyl-phosphate GlcNAc-1-phosphate transferase